MTDRLFELVKRQTEHMEPGTISMQQELRLMLLRHWTLEDSVQHSNYVIAALKLTKDKDQNCFKEFMAQLGIPLEQARQKYQYMDPELRQTLKRRILDKSHVFGIERILISSFVSQINDSLQMSALDMAYAVSSLLEAPYQLQNMNDSELRKNNNLQDGSQLMADKALENLNTCQNNNFWIAYDSLDSKNASAILCKGIEMAKDLQQAIVRMGKSLLDRREVKVAHLFRYVMIENDFLKDTTIFQFPLALQKLGLFILELHHSEKKKAS